MAWRTLAMSALAFGTVKIATSPIWLIRSAQQIEVNNQRLLSEENVQALVPVPYPQSLLSIKPEVLANSLTAHASIEDAVVRRKLIPPKLQVQITEKNPVAIALPNTERPLQTIPDKPEPFQEPGLIDAEGYWMPRNSFAELGAIANPPLQITGMRASDITAWQTIYKEIARSPVSITAIDWRRSDNLVLQSELGAVHLGPYSKHFSEQLLALDQLRQLEDKVNPKQVAFINLQDPKAPLIEILQATSDPLSSPP
ncbi:MAG: FtsQ-type POTRA domain-containing protein [Cyanobacteria bacterium J06598_1]